MNTVIHPRTLDCAGAESVFLAGDAGPIWRVTEGVVALDAAESAFKEPQAAAGAAAAATAAAANAARGRGADA